MAWLLISWLEKKDRSGVATAALKTHVLTNQTMESTKNS